MSLASAIAFQLSGRQGTGNPFNPSSQAHSLVAGWLHLDPWLPAGGPGLPARWGSPCAGYRPLAVAEAIALLDVLRGGYLPVPFVIGILPFSAAPCGRAPARHCSGLVRWGAGRPRVGRGQGRRAAGRPRRAPGLSSVPAWASGLHTQMTTDQVAPTAQAESWVEHHVPHTRPAARRRHRLGRPGRPRLRPALWGRLVLQAGCVNNLDPSVRRTLGGGWRDFQYVIETPSMRAALAGSGSQALPQVAQAVDHSHARGLLRQRGGRRRRAPHHSFGSDRQPCAGHGAANTSASNATKAGNHT